MKNLSFIEFDRFQTEKEKGFCIKLIIYNHAIKPNFQSKKTCYILHEHNANELFYIYNRKTRLKSFFYKFSAPKVFYIFLAEKNTLLILK